MIAVAWSALGILAVAVFGVLAVMVSQGGQLRSEMGQLRSEMGQLRSELNQRIDVLAARIDQQTARIDALVNSVADLRAVVQTLSDRVDALEHRQPI